MAKNVGTSPEMSDAIAYADRRASETGRAYIVSDMGHALMDCAMNRRTVADIGCVVVYHARGGI